MLGKIIRFNKKDFENSLKWSEKESSSPVYDYFRKLVYYIHDNNPRNYPINTKHPKSDGRVSVQNVYKTLLEDIKNEKLYSNIEQENIIDNWIKKGTINRWLTKRNKQGKVKEYTLDDFTTSVRIYVRRLLILEKNINSYFAEVENINDHQVTFSEEYKTAIEICFYGFNDPAGEKVDLLAQREVALEIDARLVYGRDINDIDEYLALTPWLDEGKAYKDYIELDASKKIVIEGLIKKDVELDSKGNIWNDIWDYLGHQKYYNPTMIINAELRFPWYFCYQEKESEEINFYTREKVKNEIELFDQYFKNEYNLNGMYNYFTANEIIDSYRSLGGWKSFLNNNFYNEWIKKQDDVWKSLGNYHNKVIEIINKNQ
ncbi:MAG: hypothetical protein ACJ0G8_05890 [Dehalococcoidia bacterium]